MLDPMRARRTELLATPMRLRELAMDGSARARRLAGERMVVVRDAMKISYR